MNIFHLTGILGLVSVTIAVLITKPKHRKKFQYPLFILGGILLAIYSVYIEDSLFFVLQIVFTISAIYGLLRINREEIKDAFEHIEHLRITGRIKKRRKNGI